MNIETYFNAYHESYTLWAAYEFGDPMEHYSNHDRRERQYKAFRARILRIYAEKDGEIVILKEGAKYLKETRDKRDDRIEHLENDLSQCVQWKDKQIAELVQGVAEYRKEIIEKDEEIRALEKYIKDHDYKAILDYMEKYLDGDIE